MLKNILLVIVVYSWIVSRYALGECPVHHNPQEKITGVFGETVILSCDLEETEKIPKCYDGVWYNSLREKRTASDCNENHCVIANDNKSRSIFYLYNLAYDQISSYDCVCQRPHRAFYRCYDLTAVCQLEMNVGNIKTVYNGSYLRSFNRTHVVEIDEFNSFSIKCQHGAKLASNCTGQGSIASMSLNNCSYTCSLPMAPNVEPCIVKVILQVHASSIELMNFSMRPTRDKPTTDKPMKSTSKPGRRWPPNAMIAPTSNRYLFTTDVTTSSPKSDKSLLIGSVFQSDTPLHTKVIYIIIYGSSVGVMLLLIATSMVRIYHIYYKGEGKYKADVYRPGSIYGQSVPPNKDYEKYAHVVFDENEKIRGSPSSSGDAV